MKSKIVLALAGVILLGSSSALAQRARQTTPSGAGAAATAAASAKFTQQATELSQLFSRGFVNASRIIGGTVPANMVGLNVQNEGAVADLAQALKNQPLAYETLKAIATRLNSLKEGSTQDAGTSIVSLVGRVYNSVLALSRAGVQVVKTETGVDFIDATKTLAGIDDDARATLRVLADIAFDGVLIRSLDAIITKTEDDSAALGALDTLESFLGDISAKAQGLSSGDIKGLALATHSAAQPRANRAEKSVTQWAYDLITSCGSNGRGGRKG